MNPAKQTNKQTNKQIKLDLIKITKVLSLISSVLFVILIAVVFVWCAAFVYRENYFSKDDISYLMIMLNNYIPCFVISASTLLILIIATIVLKIIAKKNNIVKPISYREKLNTYVDQNSTKKIIKKRNIIDLIATQISLLCFIGAFDYLLFFTDFTRNNINNDLGKAFTLTILCFLMGLAISIARAIYSELISKKEFNNLSN